MNPRVTVLSTADFHSSVWTNKQYMAVGLAQKTDVSYIESMGLRAPTISRADVRRVFDRLANRSGVADTKKTSHLPENLRIISPRVLPFHKYRAARIINTELVRANILPQLEVDSQDVLWTFSPLTYGLEKYFSRVVYHSVDLLHTLPGVPAATLLKAEKELAVRADHVLASSNGVATHLKQFRADVQLWQNVADVERFTGQASEKRERCAVFAGNITPTKVDFELLREVADRGTVLKLAGPVNIDGVAGDRQLDDLLGRPNVQYLGNLSLDELAKLFGRSAVGLIPYHENDYTRGVFPLKVYEYMGAGMHVVSTPIASLAASPPDGVNVVRSADYANVVEHFTGAWTVQAGRAQIDLAKDHSWSRRIDQAWELITRQGN